MLPEVPGQTAMVARAAFPGGALAMRVRDELGQEIRIFTVVVPETVKFREAAGAGRLIWEIAPENPGATRSRSS